MKAKFAYNWPQFGEVEVNQEMTEEEIIKCIEQSYPEAVDVEILEIEDIG